MDSRMVDNEDQRQDRKEIPESPTLSGNHENMERSRQLPNRAERRRIAKRRGVFKHQGLWPYINKRASNDKQDQN